jgi:type IV secretion system protein VirB10
LGQPILDHQRSSLGAGTVDNDRLASESQRAESARNQKLAELKAARESTILVQPSATPAEPSPAIAGSDAPSGQIPSSDKLALSPAGDPNAQQRKADFQKTPDKGSDVDPHRLVAMPSPYTLMAGTIMPASLITGLNSDLPGLVIAQTTENIYDTATGTILLVPQGSRLIGSYDSVVAFGQSRALVVWQRIILPDGSSIQIDNLPATDAAGYAGLADQVDYHTWQLLKGVGLSTLLGVGTEASIGNDESDLVRAIRQSTQQSASQAGQQVVSKQLNVQPTIKIRPGWPLRVIVQKDLVLRPWKESRPWQN